MVDVFSILSSNYKAIGSTPVPSKGKYVAVDPKLYEGTWSGTYANKKTFKITVSQVSGFRAQASYQSGTTFKNQSILIKDGSFRVGDTKFLLGAKAGTAIVKNVVTDPASGQIFLDTAQATRN